jgi:hypothetical protein
MANSLRELTASVAILALGPVLSVPGLEAVPVLVAAQVHLALLAPQPGALQAARKLAAAAEFCHELWPVIHAIQADRVGDISRNGVAVFSQPNGLQGQQTEINFECYLGQCGGKKKKGGRKGWEEGGREGR